MVEWLPPIVVISIFLSVLFGIAVSVVDLIMFEIVDVRSTGRMG